MQKISLTERISLYCADALGILDALPSGSVDAILTDPPYSSGGLTLGARHQDQHSKYQKSSTFRRYPTMLGDTKDQRSWTFWCVLWLTQCLRVAKDGSPLLVFTDWRQLPCLSDAVQAAGWMWNGLVVWHKPSARPQKGRFRSQCEYVLFASKGKFVEASQACLPGVYAYAVNTARKVHVASKPVDLMADLLKVAASDAIVLDPFMGGSPVG